MGVEDFAFNFTHLGSAYAVQVKRFAVDQELHLWTLVRQPRADERIFTIYEGPIPGQMWWHPMNDKRDELMKLVAKPESKDFQPQPYLLNFILPSLNSFVSVNFSLPFLSG